MAYRITRQYKMGTNTRLFVDEHDDLDDFVTLAVNIYKLHMS